MTNRFTPNRNIKGPENIYIIESFCDKKTKRNAIGMPEEILNFSQVYHAAKRFGVCRIDKVEYIYDSKEDKLVRIDVQEKRKEKERLKKLGKSK